VCLNILKKLKDHDGWLPIFGITNILMGLMTLFIEPNPDDPLNHEAANVMIKDEKKFKQNVDDSLRGGYVDGRQYEKLL